MQMKKWVAALLAICLLLSAAACGNSNSPEKQYAAVIQEKLDGGDTAEAQKILKEALKNFPDSQILLDLKEKMNGKPADSEKGNDTVSSSEASTEKPAPMKNTEPPTAEQVQKIFEQLSNLYVSWFTSMNLEYDGSSAKSVHTASSYNAGGEEYAYRVTNASVKTKADLDALFLPYVSQEVYDRFTDPIESWGYDLQPCRYLDVDGMLYVVVPDLIFSALDQDVQVEPQDDGSFLVQFIRAIFVRENSPQGGTTEYLRCSMRYGSTAEGYCFYSYSAKTMMTGQRIDTGTYVVNTEGSDLMLHNVPSDSMQSRTGAVKAGTVVTVQQSIPDWAFIESEDFDYGWVSTKYLVPYTGNPVQNQTNNPPSNNSNGNPIDQIINGGLQIADGVLRSIL